MLLGEYLVNRVTEVSPSDVAAFFGSSEVVAKSLELLARKNDLGHVQADAELSLSNVARSKLVKVTEELSNTCSLLLAEQTNAS